MNMSNRWLIIIVVGAAATIAATTTAPNYLTLQRVIALTQPASAPSVSAYKVDIAGIGSLKLLASKPAGQIENINEFLFPTSFEPPQALGNISPLTVLPSTPTDFGKINVGWTVRLNIKPYGKFVELSGAADFVAVELLPASYGAVAGPIYSDRSHDLLTLNKVEQPKVQTTSTYFTLFALPGETYDVNWYRGTKAEQHKITVTAK